jgi:hypothetical protein
VKPRVVIKNVETGQYRRGKWGYTDNLQLARVWRSAGMAISEQSTTWVAVPVQLVEITSASDV